MAPLLQVESVAVTFSDPPHRKGRRVLHDVSFAVHTGESLGMMGESGAGKSTLARLILGLTHPSAGQIRFASEPVMVWRQRRIWPQQVQMVWQDPLVTLNPYDTVGGLITEPMILHRLGNPNEVPSRLNALLAAVDLPATLVSRKPHELSGGQGQRVAIARALALNPRLLICDEIFVHLDLPRQVQMLQLLGHLQQQFGLTLLMISHDADILRKCCSSGLVLEKGRVIQTGPADQVFQPSGYPTHPRYDPST